MTNERVIRAWTDLLDTFAYDDLDSSVEAASETLSAYDDSYLEERLVLERLHYHRRESELYDESTETEFFDTHIEVQLARFGGFTLLELLQISPETVEVEELKETFEEIRQVERELLPLRQAAEERLTSVSLPPMIAILRFDSPTRYVPVGTSIELPVTIANIGTSTAKSIDLKFKLADSDEVIFERHIDELPAETESTHYAAIDYLTPGVTRIRCASLFEGVQIDSATSHVEVVTKAELVKIILEQLSELESSLVTDKYSLKGERRSINRPVTTATKHISHAINYAEQHSIRKADNRIRTAMNTLSSLLNRLETTDADGEQPQPRNNSFDMCETALSTQLKSIVEDLELARRATK